MKPYDSEHERAQAKGLFVRLNVIALLVPFGVVLLLILYTYLADIELTKAQWKLVVFCLWLCTMTVLIREGLKGVIRPRRFLRPWLDESRSRTRNTKHATISKWENRQTMRLGKSFFLTGILVPGFAMLIVYIYVTLLGLELRSADWKMVVAIVWVSGGILLCRLALLAFRQKLS